MHVALIDQGRDDCVNGSDDQHDLAGVCSTGAFFGANVDHLQCCFGTATSGFFVRDALGVVDIQNKGTVGDCLAGSDTS